MTVVLILEVLTAAKIHKKLIHNAKKLKNGKNT